MLCSGHARESRLPHAAAQERAKAKATGTSEMKWCIVMLTASWISSKLQIRLGSRCNTYFSCPAYPSSSASFHKLQLPSLFHILQPIPQTSAAQPIPHQLLHSTNFLSSSAASFHILQLPSLFHVLQPIPNQLLHSTNFLSSSAASFHILQLPSLFLIKLPRDRACTAPFPA